MQTLNLNENVLGWDCDTLKVIYNGESKDFETLWELQMYLDHTYGVMLMNEESLIDDQLH
ncbi:hypothetical protein [Motiliproteus sp. MSK22-1]|uniref:hypothetical protein n=1 Tax=Motiliproteus sp. MSK22-1 TaxID=1897630 RepID=UPI000977497E|nr:hypothetical protein [Motiliproteus sp. MSK22-1]OMH25727.1 hypothetical protein BGP75_24650 [Motiliproteus sp. MSK22-1]